MVYRDLSQSKGKQAQRAGMDACVLCAFKSRLIVCMKDSLSAFADSTDLFYLSGSSTLSGLTTSPSASFISVSSPFFASAAFFASSSAFFFASASALFFVAASS